MSLENGAAPAAEEVAAVSAEPAAAPSYVDAFPSLPMGAPKARAATRSFAAASGSAVRSSRVTEVRWQCKRDSFCSRHVNDLLRNLSLDH